MTSRKRLGAMFLFCTTLLTGCAEILEEIETRDAPPVPVSCFSRDALLSSGKVVEVRNDSSETLKFTLYSDGQSQDFVLAAGESKEFGPLEGWQFAHGTEYRVRSIGYKAVSCIVSK